MKVLGPPNVWGLPRNLGEDWILFANKARMIDSFGVDSPARPPASEGDRQSATVPADVRFWIDLERFVERIGNDKSARRDRDVEPRQMATNRP